MNIKPKIIWYIALLLLCLCGIYAIYNFNDRIFYFIYYLVFLFVLIIIKPSNY